VEDNAGIDQEKLELEIPQFPALTEAQLDEFVAATIERFPNETARLVQPGPYLFRQRVVGSGEIQEYKQRYREWINSLRDFLINVHLKLNEVYQKQAVAFTLHSDGIRPAQDLFIELRAFGGLLIQHWNGRLPEIAAIAPDPPRLGLYRQAANQFRIPRTLLPAKPEEFYYTSTDQSPKASLSYMRAEFFHNRKPERLPFGVMLAPNSASYRGLVECTVTGRNLPELVTKRLEISFAFQEADSRESTIKCLEHLALPEW
jgi:hypothetical protein